jgi:hypothetical protein
VVRGAWCVVRGAWCLVRGAWCVVRGAWCVVCSADACAGLRVVKGELSDFEGRGEMDGEEKIVRGANTEVYLCGHTFINEVSSAKENFPHNFF